MERRATIWFRTKIGRGLAPRAGRLVKEKDDLLLFHSIGLDHVKSIRIQDGKVATLTEEVVCDEKPLVGLEWWNNQYEIHIFHQESPITEPVLYGDDTIFAIGWNSVVNSNNYDKIHLNDEIVLERTSDEALPNFNVSSGEEVTSWMKHCEPTDVGEIDGGILKLVLNVKPEFGVAEKSTMY